MVEAISHCLVLCLSLDINSDFPILNAPLLTHPFISWKSILSSSLSHLCLTPDSLVSALLALLNYPLSSHWWHLNNQTEWPFSFFTLPDFCASFDTGDAPLCPLLSFVFKQGMFSFWKWFLLLFFMTLHALAHLPLGRVVHSKVLAMDSWFFSVSFCDGITIFVYV